MDELTRERYPHPLPIWEKRRKPPSRVVEKGVEQPVDAAAINRRRVVLCGTDDLTVLLQGGDVAELARVTERRLIEAIRRVA